MQAIVQRQQRKAFLAGYLESLALLSGVLIATGKQRQSGNDPALAANIELRHLLAGSEHLPLPKIDKFTSLTRLQRIKARWPQQQTLIALQDSCKITGDLPLLPLVQLQPGRLPVKALQLAPGGQHLVLIDPCPVFTVDKLPIRVAFFGNIGQKLQKIEINPVVAHVR